MITDAQTRLFNAQAITAAGTYVSNAYDTGSAGTPSRNIGRGQPLRLKVTVDQTFAGGTGLTLNFVQSANPDLSNATVIGSVTPTSPTPAAGTSLWDVHVPQNTQRFIGMQAVTTGVNTAGALSANIVSDTGSDTYYPSNTGY